MKSANCTEHKLYMLLSVCGIVKMIWTILCRPLKQTRYHTYFNIVERGSAPRSILLYHTSKSSLSEPKAIIQCRLVNFH